MGPFSGSDAGGSFFSAMIISFIPPPPQKKISSEKLPARCIRFPVRSASREFLFSIDLYVAIVVVVVVARVGGSPLPNSERSSRLLSSRILFFLFCVFFFRLRNIRDSDRFCIIIITPESVTAFGVFDDVSGAADSPRSPAIVAQFPN